MGKINFINNIVAKMQSVSKPALRNTENLHSAPVRNTIKDSFVRNCECISEFDDSKCVVFGIFPDDYVNVRKFYVEAEPAHVSRFTKTVIPAKPAHWEDIQTIKASYYIKHLFSHGKGQGTEAVKEIVKQSMNDVRTQGRVTLQSDIIDGKTSPSGFYYKLGFRFANENKNQILQQWLENGGIREKAPLITGFMYLPRENLLHCLNY